MRDARSSRDVNSRLSWLLAGVCVVVTLLVAALLLVAAPDPARAAVTQDSPSYMDFAERLAAGVPVPVEPMRTPLYPAFLALVGCLPGRSVEGAVAVQIVLSGAICLFIFRIGWRLGGPIAAAAASLLYAGNLESAATALRIGTETVFTVLVVAALWIELVQTNRFAVRALAIGVLLGLAALCRPVGVLVPLCFLASWTLRFAGKEWREGLIGSLLLVAGLAAVLLPWVVRNARVYGAATISTIGTYNLLHYSAASVVAQQRGESIDAASRRLKDEVAERTTGHPRDALWVRTEKQVAFEILCRDPVLYARIHLRATLNTFMPDNTVLSLLGKAPGSQGMLERIRQVGIIRSASEYIVRNPNTVAFLGLSVGVMVVTLSFAALGIPVMWQRSGLSSTVLLLLFAGGLLLVAGPAAVPRFRVPAWPAVCLLAGLGFARVWEHVALRLNKRTQDCA